MATSSGKRAGRGKTDRTPGKKGGVRTSRGKARPKRAATAVGKARPKRAATAVAKAGAASSKVRQTENDERREDLAAHGSGAPAASAQPAEAETTAGTRWSSTPTGVRLSLDTLTVDAAQAEVERGELKAVVSVCRGDELLYRERVNFDWPGGRDKFLRKAARALTTASVATRISDTLLAEMRDALRTHTRSARPTP